jgi:hypothetical protein
MTDVLGGKRLSCNMTKHHPTLLACMCDRIQKKNASLGIDIL